MYYLLESKRVTGPFEEEELRDRIYRGQLPVSTLACRENDPQEKWAPLEQLLLGIDQEMRQQAQRASSSWNPPATRSPAAYRGPVRTPPDPNVAVLLEILPGVFLHVFGIGNIYAGNIGGGVVLMVGYWLIQLMNLFLCFFLIGIPLLLITYIVFIILGAKTASERARTAQADAMYHYEAMADYPRAY